MRLKRTILAVAAALTLGAGGLQSAAADPQHGQWAMGPGMMGPGMMGGDSPDYGPGPMGPGAPRGYGMGPGMMGPGMMGGMGYGMLYQLDLSPDQWQKVTAIHEELAKKRWDLAGKAREEAFKLHSLMAAEKRDRAAITNQFKVLQEARLQSFQARLDAQEKVDGVLTPEQRDRLRRFAPWWGHHM